MVLPASYVWSPCALGLSTCLDDSNAVSSLCAADFLEDYRAAPHKLIDEGAQLAHFRI